MNWREFYRIVMNMLSPMEKASLAVKQKHLLHLTSQHGFAGPLPYGLHR